MSEKHSQRKKDGLKKNLSFFYFSFSFFACTCIYWVNEHKGSRVQLCLQSCESGCATWLPLRPSWVQEMIKSIPLLYRLLCVRYRISTAILICGTFLVPNFLKVVPLWHLQKFPKWTLKNFNFSKNESNKKFKIRFFYSVYFFDFTKNDFKISFKNSKIDTQKNFKFWNLAKKFFSKYTKIFLIQISIFSEITFYFLQKLGDWVRPKISQNQKMQLLILRKKPYLDPQILCSQKV